MTVYEVAAGGIEKLEGDLRAWRLAALICSGALTLMGVYLFLTMRGMFKKLRKLEALLNLLEKTQP